MSQQFNIDQLKKFIAKYQGQFVRDTYGLYRGQCVSLCKQWLKFNGWQQRSGNAIDWQKNGYNGYAFYPYHTGNIPLVGDMPVFRIGKYGHIGVVQSATNKTMRLFNQNYPHGNTTDAAQVQTFDYAHCVGFLRKL